MARFIISYDERVGHSYAELYKTLNDWGAAHLQNSVWLLEINSSADAIRDAIQRHTHPNDTVCVIQLTDGHANWATNNARQEGNNWLKTRYP
jgi:CRISPR/Cas system-associated endoribonuclease Cas2